MPDLPIVIPDTAVAPKDYTLSGTQELALKTVRALIDGSGAATAFLPTLQLLDPNGHVMWEGATADTVAAGGSADVSWFPGLGGTGSTGATGASSAWFYAKRETSQTIPAGNTRRIGWTVHETSDSSVFSVTTGTVTDDTVKGLKAGIYVAQMNMGWQAPQNYKRSGQIVTAFSGALGLSHSPATDSTTDQTAAGFQYNFGDVKVLIPTAVPGEISVLAINQDVADHNVTGCYFSILYLSNSTLAT